MASGELGHSHLRNINEFNILKNDFFVRSELIYFILMNMFPTFRI